MMKNTLGLVGIAVTLFIPASLALAATMSTVAPIENVARRHRDNHIREEILGLVDEEKGSDQALLELKSESRVDVLRIVHEDLLAQPVRPSTLALKTAILLRMVELLPTLANLTENSQGWDVELALIKIAKAADAPTRKATAARLQERLAGYLPVMKQIVIVDGLTELGVVIGNKSFAELTASPDYQVRIAAVRNFLSLRISLTTNEQIERFRASFQLKPYQARLPAMEEFQSLDNLSREALKSSIPSGLCLRETRTEVKLVCEKIKEWKK